MARIFLFLQSYLSFPLIQFFSVCFSSSLVAFFFSEAVVGTGRLPRSHCRHQSALRPLWPDICTHWAIISSAAYPPALTRSLPLCQCTLHTYSDAYAGKVEAKEKRRSCCDEWNTLMTNGCFAGSWQHFCFRQWITPHSYTRKNVVCD